MSTKFFVRISNLFQKGKRRASRLIFPDDCKCIFCGREISDFYSQPFCQHCAQALPFNLGHRCKFCDAPIYNEADVCDRCQAHPPAYVKAFCPLLYEGDVKRQILAFKDENQRYLAKGFALILARAVEGLDFDVITYIPMTPEKEKRRGFNQAKLLAECLGLLLDRPVLGLFEKTRDVEQKSLSYQQRQAATIGTYKLKPAKLSRTDRVLIVDDILTTGATVNYCSALLHPKVKSVYVCCISRDMPTAVRALPTGTKAKAFSISKKPGLK